MKKLIDFITKNRKIVSVVLLNIFVVTVFIVAWIFIHSECYSIVQQRADFFVKGRFIFDQELPQILYEDIKADPNVKSVERVKRNLPTGFETVYEKRKPLFSVRKGSKFIILDEEGVVLNVVNQNLELLLVSGIQVSAISQGKKWQTKDIEVAKNMAKLIHSDDTLNNLVSEIDLSNLDGKRDKEESHIVLHTKNGCRLLWGKSDSDMELKPYEKIENLKIVLKQYKSLDNIEYVKVFAKSSPVVKEKNRSSKLP